MIRAIIFDLDGTLLNTLEDLTDSVNAAMEHFGLPQRSQEEVRRGVGNGARRLMQLVIPGGEEHPRFQEILDYYTVWYEAHCKIRTRPYDGLLPALRVLKENKVRMAIVSNKGDGAVRELSERYFEGLMDAAVGEREGIRRKPAPDSVLESMRLLGSAPEETVYVGDSEVDFETAGNAGLPVALVSWGFRPRRDLERFHSRWLFDEPGQLLELLKA